MNEFLTNILWLDGFLVAGLGIGFLLGRYGISGLWTDITNIKTDIQNLKIQSPISITPVTKVTPVVPSTQVPSVHTSASVAHGSTATPAVLTHPVGQAPVVAPVVAGV
jgi:hypothetical protein